MQLSEWTQEISLTSFELCYKKQNLHTSHDALLESSNSSGILPFFCKKDMMESCQSLSDLKQKFRNFSKIRTSSPPELGNLAVIMERNQLPTSWVERTDAKRRVWDELYSLTGSDCCNVLRVGLHLWSRQQLFANLCQSQQSVWVRPCLSGDWLPLSAVLQSKGAVQRLSVLRPRALGNPFWIPVGCNYLSSFTKCLKD